jgi:hypothetical protein
MHTLTRIDPLARTQHARALATAVDSKPEALKSFKVYRWVRPLAPSSIGKSYRIMRMEALVQGAGARRGRTVLAQGVRQSRNPRQEIGWRRNAKDRARELRPTYKVNLDPRHER